MLNVEFLDNKARYSICTSSKVQNGLFCPLAELLENIQILQAPQWMTIVIWLVSKASIGLMAGANFRNS